jgi:S-(hydroxymethyl)glutathione dehydrogenase/alcohol dehydrogenase
VSCDRSETEGKERREGELGAHIVKAAVLHEYRQPLVIEEVEVLPPRAREVLMRFVASGMCHSDLARIQRERPSRLPIVLAHERAGIVEAVGASATSVKLGEDVVLCAI